MPDHATEAAELLANDRAEVATAHALLAIHEQLVDIARRLPRPVVNDLREIRAQVANLHRPASPDRYAANEDRRKRAQREGAPEPDPLDELPCPKCGHGIDSHGWDGDYAITCCLTCDDPDDCRQAPSDIARHLIAHGYTASPDQEEES